MKWKEFIYQRVVFGIGDESVKGFYRARRTQPLWHGILFQHFSALEHWGDPSENTFSLAVWMLERLIELTLRLYFCNVLEGTGIIIRPSLQHAEQKCYEAEFHIVSSKCRWEFSWIYECKQGCNHLFWGHMVWSFTFYGAIYISLTVNIMSRLKS